MSEKNTWWMVVKVMDFSLSCLRERKLSLSRSDINSIKALSTLRQPFPSAATLASPSTATNLVDKNSETSSSKYWRTCMEKRSNSNHGNAPRFRWEQSNLKLQDEHSTLTDLMSLSSFNNFPPSTSITARCSRRYF